MESCVTAPHYKRPSVETFLHAICLTMGDAKWMGHTHTESVLSVVCSKHGARPFMAHIYPDEIVVCGRNIAVVPYIDPGLHLARAVRDELKRFKEANGKGPRLLLMVNHGPVALGNIAADVFNILAMADKWARILIGTYALGGPQYMPLGEADRINIRPDEEYRRKQIAAR